jgi:glycogen synthase
MNVVLIPLQDTLVPADADAVASTCARAAEVYNTPLFREMVYNCISQDLSWAKPAIKVGMGWMCARCQWIA